MKKISNNKRKCMLALGGNSAVEEWGTLARFVPEEIKAGFGPDIQSVFPALAKNASQMNLIEGAIQQIPTTHRFVHQDATKFQLARNSIHLVLTSPPYWTLKQYREHDRQLGHVINYDEFLDQLDAVTSKAPSPTSEGEKCVSSSGTERLSNCSRIIERPASVYC
ncbi:MAG: hypothetical protein WCC95_22455 [Candidatus Sulfotelmatobacter sp.]